MTDQLDIFSLSEVALQQLIERFTTRYGSFESKEYLADERIYKVEAAQRMRERLSRDILRELINRGQFEEAKAQIKRAYQGNNLLNQWDVQPILDAAAEPLARRLYELLYADGQASFDQRFTAWIDVLSLKSPRCWPAATFFLMFHDPEQHLFVKSTPYRSLLAALESPIQWDIHPNPRSYKQFQGLGARLLERLRMIGARDMIDVQSFIWIVQDEASKIDDETDEDEEEAVDGAEALSFTEWQATVNIQHPLYAQFARDYPAWLTTRYGTRFRLKGLSLTRYDVMIDGHPRRRIGRFRQDGGVYVWAGALSEADLQKAQRRLNNPVSLKPRNRFGVDGFRFIAYTDDDYQLLKELPMMVVTSRINRPELLPFYAATEKFVDEALRTDGSLFGGSLLTAETPIWSLATIEDLYERFNKHPDESKRDFMSKFHDQLMGAPPQTIQLAAEILYVHLVITVGMKPITKRRQIEAVLGLLPAPLKIPSDMDKALETGVANAGVAFLIHKPFHLAFLVEFARRWKQLDENVRTEALDDPWMFKQWLFEVPMQTAYAQREALLHLVHPDWFEAIVSRDHKKQFAQQYASLVKEPTSDVDRQLRQIREQLTPQFGSGFDIYQIGKIPPPPPSLLPRSLGPRLRPYVEFAAHLNDAEYSAEQIVNVLGQIHPRIVDLAAAPDADELTSDLMLLRLLEPLDDGRFRRWKHLGDVTVDHMLRYAALTLLVPDKDNIDAYVLPVAVAPFDGGAHQVSAWPLGEDLLHWYEEVDLVQRLDDGRWQCVPGVLEPFQGTTTTAQALNTFLEHLRRFQNEQGGFPTIENSTLPQLAPDVLEQRIAEIQMELLIDRTTIQRIYRSLVAGVTPRYV